MPQTNANDTAMSRCGTHVLNGSSREVARRCRAVEECGQGAGAAASAATAAAGFACRRGEALVDDDNRADRVTVLRVEVHGFPPLGRVGRRQARTDEGEGVGAQGQASENDVVGGRSEGGRRVHGRDCAGGDTSTVHLLLQHLAG